MNLTVIDHPLVAHKLSLMREADCSTYRFRTLTRELARLMAYEASRELPSEPPVANIGSIIHAGRSSILLVNFSK